MAFVRPQVTPTLTGLLPRLVKNIRQRRLTFSRTTLLSGIHITHWWFYSCFELSCRHYLSFTLLDLLWVLCVPAVTNKFCLLWGYLEFRAAVSLALSLEICYFTPLNCSCCTMLCADNSSFIKPAVLTVCRHSVWWL